MLKKKLGIEGIEVSWDLFLHSYYKIPTTLIIPEGCRRIRDGAFSNCEKLKKVVIPESVEKIGDYAFYCCRKAEIILKKPESKFKEIGGEAFYGVRDVKEEIRN